MRENAEERGVLGKFSPRVLFFPPQKGLHTARAQNERERERERERKNARTARERERGREREREKEITRGERRG